MHRDTHILLICGMPTSGKTTFGNWLRDQKGFLHLDLESRDCLEVNHLPRFWGKRIWNLDRAGVSRFIAYLQSLKRNVVMTWAFHTDLIPFVRELVAAGAVPWWFEGDRLASRVKHGERGRIIKNGVAQPGRPDLAHYDRYVASLVAHWTEIEPIFSPNIVRTLDPTGTYLDPQEIYRRMYDYKTLA